MRDIDIKNVYIFLSFQDRFGTYRITFCSFNWYDNKLLFWLLLVVRLMYLVSIYQNNIGFLGGQNKLKIVSFKLITSNIIVNIAGKYWY